MWATWWVAISTIQFPKVNVASDAFVRVSWDYLGHFQESFQFDFLKKITGIIFYFGSHSRNFHKLDGATSAPIVSRWVAEMALIVKHPEAGSVITWMWFRDVINQVREWNSWWRKNDDVTRPEILHFPPLPRDSSRPSFDCCCRQFLTIPSAFPSSFSLIYYFQPWHLFNFISNQLSMNRYAEWISLGKNSAVGCSWSFGR